MRPETLVNYEGLVLAVYCTACRQFTPVQKHETSEQACERICECAVPCEDCGKPDHEGFDRGMSRARGYSRDRKGLCGQCGSDRRSAVWEAKQTARLATLPDYVGEDPGQWCEFGNDRFFSDIDYASEEGVRVLVPCVLLPVSFSDSDAESLIESMCGDHHEDIREEFPSTGPLVEAVNKWLGDSPPGSLFPDESQGVLRIPPTEDES